MSLPDQENPAYSKEAETWETCLKSGLSPLTEEEINDVQFLNWTQHKEIWGITRNSASPAIRHFVARVDELQPSLYPWQCFCWREIRCQGLDEKVQKFVDANRDVLNHEFVKHWLSKLPISPEQIYVGQMDSTAVVGWTTVVEHWQTFSCLDRLNVADDTSSWQLFFHPDDFAVFCCTDAVYRKLGADSKGFLSAEAPLAEKLKAAADISRAYCAGFGGGRNSLSEDCT